MKISLITINNKQGIVSWKNIYNVSSSSIKLNTNNIK